MHRPCVLQPMDLATAVRAEGVRDHGMEALLARVEELEG